MIDSLPKSIFPLPYPLNGSKAFPAKGCWKSRSRSQTIYFCFKICNLALEANLAHSFLRLSVVPWVLMLFSFLVGIPSFLTLFRGITFIADPGSTCTCRSFTSPIYPEGYSGLLCWWRYPSNKKKGFSQKCEVWLLRLHLLLYASVLLLRYIIHLYLVYMGCILIGFW